MLVLVLVRTFRIYTHVQKVVNYMSDRDRTRDLGISDPGRNHWAIQRGSKELKNFQPNSNRTACTKFYFATFFSGRTDGRTEERKENKN